MFGLDNIDAMGERGPHKIGIEQRNHSANACDAKPYSQVFGTIRHQQTDDFAFRQTLLERPAGILVLNVRQAPRYVRHSRSESRAGASPKRPASSSITVDITRSRFRGIDAVSSRARNQALAAEPLAFTGAVV